MQKITLEISGIDFKILGALAESRGMSIEGYASGILRRRILEEAGTAGVALRGHEAGTKEWWQAYYAAGSSGCC